MFELTAVTLASFLAGLIDAIAGGGGLILIPALFSAYPSAPPATLLGSNKGAAMWGTLWASRQYLKRVRLNWASLLPGMALAAAASACGAWAVTHARPELLRQALPLVLLALLIYTWAKKDLGRQHAPLGPRALTWRCAALGLILGFYDGFFGPGTGSFFVFAFVRWLGFDFLHASAAAKLMNLSTNLAAIALFASHGHLWWQLAALMALANVAGSLLGTRLALKHGVGFVRGVFLVVVGALILKTGADAFL